MRLTPKMIRFILVVFFGMSFCYAQGQFNLPGQQYEKIRFELINNLIIIPIEINGVELSFLLDTGVSKTILFNITNIDFLEVNNLETIYLRGLGDGKAVKAFRSKHNFLKIGNALSLNHELYVVFDQDINFTPRLGVPVHGIIGYSLFKDFIVEINYASKFIRLNTPKEYKYKKCKRCQTYDLIFYNNKPYVNAEVTITKDALPVKLLIDTGSSDALWLFEDDNNGITSKNNNYFRDFLGRGLSGNIYGKRSKINEFSLKNFVLENVNTAFPDSSAVKHAKNIEDRNGSLSAEILRRFNIIFDYNNSKLTLKKNSEFKTDFSYNKSGIVLEQLGFRLVKESVENTSLDNYGRSNKDNIVISNVKSYRVGLKPAYTIVEVREGSPAQKVGLLKDDIIVSVNGKQAHTLSLQEINYFFRDRIGKTVRLKVERHNIILSKVFQLEDVFKKKELSN